MRTKHLLLLSLVGRGSVKAHYRTAYTHPAVTPFSPPCTFPAHAWLLHRTLPRLSCRALHTCPPPPPPPAAHHTHFVGPLRAGTSRISNLSPSYHFTIPAAPLRTFCAARAFTCHAHTLPVPFYFIRVSLRTPRAHACIRVYMYSSFCNTPPLLTFCRTFLPGFCRRLPCHRTPARPHHRTGQLIPAAFSCPLLATTRAARSVVYHRRCTWTLHNLLNLASGSNGIGVCDNGT